MAVHLVNPSDISFGTAVITPVALRARRRRPRSNTGRPRSSTRRSSRWTSTRSAGRRRRHRHSHGERAARVRGRQGGARARRLGGVWRHPRHAVPGRGFASRAAPTRRHRRRRSRVAAGARGLRRRPAAARSTTAAGSRAASSCRRAGSCSRAIATCGRRCRPCAAARSTARSVRCGGPTGSGRASAASTRCDPGGRRAAAAGFPLHRACRRQFLSGDAARSRSWRHEAQRSDAVRPAPGDSRRSGSS